MPPWPYILARPSIWHLRVRDEKWSDWEGKSDRWSQHCRFFYFLRQNAITTCKYGENRYCANKKLCASKHTGLLNSCLGKLCLLPYLVVPLISARITLISTRVSAHCHAILLCYLFYLEFRREYFCLNLYTTHCLHGSHRFWWIKTKDFSRTFPGPNLMLWAHLWWISQCWYTKNIPHTCICGDFLLFRFWDATSDFAKHEFWYRLLAILIKCLTSGMDSSTCFWSENKDCA